MKIAGLITEYNPFHNGHVHHMEEARRLTGADYLIVVMSGNFVQRGAPAIIECRERVKMALHGGADLVLSMPVLFSTSSAEVFARAGIGLLNLLGCVEYVVFGTEAGSLSELQKISDVLNREPDSFKEELKTFLRAGYPYPKARALALELYFNGEIDDIATLLSSPNNILGIEYLRALSYFKSSIRPITLKRWHTEYHSEALYDDVASATAIRKLLYEEDGASRIAPYVPSYTARELSIHSGITMPIRRDDLSGILQYRLNQEKDRLEEFLDFSPALKERIQRLLPACFTFSEWADALKTKDLTLTRINRALLHLILNIRESDLESYKDEDYCMFARILGFKKDATSLLSAIKANTALPIVSKMADSGKILDEKAKKLLSMDVFATDVYRNAVYQKFGTLLKDEYTAGIIKV